MATIVARRRADGSTGYTVRIRVVIGGIVHQETRTFDGRVHGKKAVQAWAIRREDELRHPDMQRAVMASRITLKEVIERYCSEYGGWGRSKNADLARLKACPIAKMPILDIEPRHLVEHVQARRRTVAGVTAGNDLTWLRVLFKTARPAWGIPCDPRVVDDAIQHCRDHRLIDRGKQRDRRPTLAELDLILDHYARADGRQIIPMSEVILFALFSGRREAEICGLRRSDYDPDRSQILVRDVKDPRRRGVNIRVTLPIEAKLVIERQPLGDLFFPYNPDSVSASFTRACKVLAIDDLHFHDLRHEAASMLFERGWTIPQVAAVTGHRTWQVLQRYTHLSGPKIIDKYANWQHRPTPPSVEADAAPAPAPAAHPAGPLDRPR